MTFTPTLYVKEGCPFCMKTRIFLLEAGLSNNVRIREFSPGSDAEQDIRSELAPHFDQISFPTAQTGPETFMSDSDMIVSHFADVAKAEPAAMPTFRAYADGLMPIIRKLYMENIEFKKQSA